MNTQRNLHDYLSLPYTLQLTREDESTWFARVLELPGCITEGDSAEEAIEMIFDAMESWIAVALEDGRPIPEPRPTEEYSGKFVVRVPRSLHRQLVEAAEREEVSLNQYINVALAEHVSGPPGVKPEPIASNWPGLSAAARRALRMAGMEREAGQLDERLFADWISHTLADVERAIQSGFYREALKKLDYTVGILQQNIEQSPFCDTLMQTFSLMRRTVETMLRLQQGALQESRSL